jgi:hypothetical protein
MLQCNSEGELHDCVILCSWHFCFSSDIDEDIPVDATAVESDPEGSQLGSENGSADDKQGK